MTKAHIEGTVEVSTVPNSLEVTFGDGQIAVEYAGATSIIPLDEDGFFLSSGGYTADKHNATIKDIAKGAYEAHMELQEQD